MRHPIVTRASSVALHDFLMCFSSGLAGDIAKATHVPAHLVNLPVGERINETVGVAPAPVARWLVKIAALTATLTLLLFLPLSGFLLLLLPPVAEFSP